MPEPMTDVEWDWDKLQGYLDNLARTVYGRDFFNLPSAERAYCMLDVFGAITLSFYRWAKGKGVKWTEMRN